MTTDHLPIVYDLEREADGRYRLRRVSHGDVTLHCICKKHRAYSVDPLQYCMACLRMIKLGEGTP
jgi:hypothetical protein